MTGRAHVWITSGLALLVFVMANALLQPALAGWRIDFTEGRLYTLNGGTRATLGSLAEPVELTFVYSRRAGQEYPVVRAYAERVRELLASFRSVGGGNIRIEEINPAPFSEAEDEALAHGITGIRTDGRDPLYFGLIGRNTVDDELVIPFLAPERESTLEYDLARLIARLDKPEPPVVGIVTDLANFRGDGQEGGYHALTEIARTFDIEPLGVSFTSIPDRIDVLMLAHAATLTEAQTYLVDQFVLAKGRALILVDPASKAAAIGGVLDPASGAARSDLGVIGQAWGLELSRYAVADAALALPVNVEAGGRVTEVGQPLFLGIPGRLMAGDDIVTAPLTRQVNLGAPGALEAFPPAGATFRPLIRTDEAPAYIDSARASGEMDPQEVIAAYAAEDGSLVLAGRLSGTLPTAFPGGPPSPDIGTGGPHLSASLVPAEIIVIADADLLDDGFYIDPRSSTAVADNAILIQNALDNLSGGDRLLALRSRTPNPRRMTRVDRLREAAEARFFDEQVRLEGRLNAAQGRLEELQAIGAAGGFFSGDLDADLTGDERAELAELRQSVVETRSRLRAIERDFRRDIDRLEAGLQAINVWGGSLLVLLAGLFAWWRRRRGTAS